MKLACLQENLAKGMGIAGRAVARSSTLPVLTNVLLEAEDGRLALAGTNLEMTIRCRIAAKIEEGGAITLPGRLLEELIKSLPPERVDMELDLGTWTANLKCGRFEANVKGIDASEFVVIPGPEEGEKPILLEVDSLSQAIDQVAMAAATDDSRPILTGVLAQFEEQSLTLAAADGFRLSVRTISLPEAVAKPVEMIIPAKALGELGRLLSLQEDPVQVYANPERNQVIFELTDVELVSQLVQGRFPDYRQIIPAEHKTRAVLGTAQFLKAVRVTRLFARDAADIVRLEIRPGESGPGQVILAATSAEMGDGVGQVDALVEGEAMEIAFNGKYLVDVLSVVDTAQVALETTNAASPGVVRPVGDDDFTHVIMPMHLGGPVAKKEGEDGDTG